MNKYLLIVLAPFYIQSHEFKLGVENIPTALLKQLINQKARVGIITNHTGIDQKRVRTIDILRQKKLKLTTIFVPEHGLSGTIKAGHDVAHGIDTVTKLPIVSLHDAHNRQKINPDLFKKIDVLFFDMQDSGMRHYTYISTLFAVLQAVAGTSTKVIVCDRPNPLGKKMEGPLVDPELISFVSIAPIPLRHAMTIGELSVYFNTYFCNKQVHLQVIPMEGYTRDYALKNLLAPLSPNIATIHACMGYSFLGLLGEIKPFHVGVGTTDAFQMITLPESLRVSSLLWQELAQELKKIGIETTTCRCLHEKKKEYYCGLKLNIANINQIEAFKAFLKTVSTLKKAGIPLEFNPIFDKVVGSKQIKLFFNNALSYSKLMQEIRAELKKFLEKAKPVFLYKPEPEIIR